MDWIYATYEDSKPLLLNPSTVFFSEFMLLMKIRNILSKISWTARTKEFMLLMKIRNIRASWSAIFPLGNLCYLWRFETTPSASEVSKQESEFMLLMKIRNAVYHTLLGGANVNLCYLWRFETRPEKRSYPTFPYWIYATYEDSKPVIWKLAKQEWDFEFMLLMKIRNQRDQAGYHLPFENLCYLWRFETCVFGGWRFHALANLCYLWRFETYPYLDGSTKEIKNLCYLWRFETRYSSMAPR